MPGVIGVGPTPCLSAHDCGVSAKLNHSNSMPHITVNPSFSARLSTRFNDALLANLINDGHKIGLVQLDQYLIAVDNATLNGVSNTFANTTQAACVASIPFTSGRATSMTATSGRRLIA